MKQIILVINPGSTSTKLAVYYNEEEFKTTSLHHSNAELSKFGEISEQRQFRTELIVNWLKSEGVELGSLTAIVARGGLLAPVLGGTYIINSTMVAQLEAGCYGKHASNLAGLIAFELGQQLDIPAFIVDPVVVDELAPVARISGFPGLTRKSIFHALNHKASAKKAARLLERSYTEVNLIVAHLGGGISIAAHRQGRVIDVNNALTGEGPFSPERTGSLPTLALIEYYFSQGRPKEDLLKEFAGKSGLVAHAGSNDLRVIEAEIDKGAEKAEFYFEAMAYQIAKEIGKVSTVLRGIVDGIVLTGGLAYSTRLVSRLRKSVEFIAPLIVLPGENELEALALGAYRVLTGQEAAHVYEEQLKEVNP